MQFLVAKTVFSASRYHDAIVKKHNGGRALTAYTLPQSFGAYVNLMRGTISFGGVKLIQLNETDIHAEKATISGYVCHTTPRSLSNFGIRPEVTPLVLNKFFKSAAKHLRAFINVLQIVSVVEHTEHDMPVDDYDQLNDGYVNGFLSELLKVFDAGEKSYKRPDVQLQFHEGFIMEGKSSFLKSQHVTFFEEHSWLWRIPLKVLDGKCLLDYTWFLQSFACYNFLAAIFLPRLPTENGLRQVDRSLLASMIFDTQCLFGAFMPLVLNLAGHTTFQLYLYHQANYKQFVFPLSRAFEGRFYTSGDSLQEASDKHYSVLQHILEVYGSGDATLLLPYQYDNVDQIFTQHFLDRVKF